jgi:hypothetical protein
MSAVPIGTAQARKGEVMGFSTHFPLPFRTYQRRICGELHGLWRRLFHTGLKQVATPPLVSARKDRFPAPWACAALLAVMQQVRSLMLAWQQVEWFSLTLTAASAVLRQAPYRVLLGAD